MFMEREGAVTDGTRPLPPAHSGAAARLESQSAARTHGENEWTAGVSYLENALQWKTMLEAGVFESQSALAEELGCHRAQVSRALKTASVLFGEPWIGRLVRSVMYEFAGRGTDRLAVACAVERVAGTALRAPSA